MKDHNLVSQARNIFDSLDKWNAFFEIQAQIDEIVNDWLRIGAEALREHFKVHPSAGWACAKWEGPRDSRWFLSEPENVLIGVGIGWPLFELHLFIYDDSHHRPDRDIAFQYLRTPEFAELESLFGEHAFSYEHIQNKSLGFDRSFNPYGESGDPEMRRRTIAWHAAHETADFVEKIARKIREITENEKITRLICELNKKTLLDSPAS